MFEIKEVSKVDAPASAFGMWLAGVGGVAACMGGVKLLILAAAC